MEKNAVEPFVKTVDRDEEGRYIVKLPWIEAKEIVQDNRSVAEQHCIRTSQKLKVEVAEEDQDFLRFLWWEDYEKEKFEIFRHR
ncbi:hypothetical protein TNCV_4762871 [Trichonephila clavipes]|nr:hypothetical protein TNCV_4762871 [Trichonephila clavipes]